MARHRSDSVAERHERVRELFLIHGLRPMEIATLLLASGELPSKTLESAHRLIRADVQSIRAALSTEQVMALSDPGETRIFIARMEYILRHAAREIEKIESIATSRTKLADGKEITTARKVDRAGIRQRWAEKYLQASRAIAAVSGVPIEAWRKQDDDSADRDRPEALSDPFQIVVSGKPIDELISLNVEAGKVN